MLLQLIRTFNGMSDAMQGIRRSEVSLLLLTTLDLRYFEQYTYIHTKEHVRALPITITMHRLASVVKMVEPSQKTFLTLFIN
ncbi:hypothetical protein T12_10132 [Trichinella patagoniensis]|uniref:Uncharacterized protein n=1 Tax=Trichinella patagoniensis TaxID=990121 RepID=A0A0V0ZBB8_9BILA|nr:hypothetical protein T12_10132 [Trichinella patagoniensis]